ncbi:LysR family transcriptional regulator [Chloroflexi bacterium TSY]|nr:LysR family transcriptional regulator [Chloroflexi bacterium TSY]
MTLDQLQILVKIVEHGSMGAAAEALYRTQPTLSVAMKKLEEEFGIEIFSREDRRLTLTPIGQAMVQKANRVLERAEEFEYLGRQLATGNEPKVKIAFDASIPIRFISGVLKQCEVDFPETSVELFAENLFGVMERLTDGEADLAVVAHIEENHLFRSLLLHKFRFYPVAAATHPLNQYENDVPLEDTKEYVQVILRDSARNAPDQSYRVIEEARQWHVNDVQTKKEIIVEGLGWGTLPDFMIKEELETHQLVPLKIENYYRFGESEIGVVGRADQPFGPVVQSLWDSFQKYANA